MSYILDALKRADSEREREREGVPGLHSKTDAWVAPDEVRASRSQPQTTVWALSAAGVLVVLGLLWFALTREPAPAAVVATPTPVQAAPSTVQPASPPMVSPMPSMPPVVATAPAAAPAAAAAAAAAPEPPPVARVLPAPPARPARPAPPARTAVPAAALPSGQAALQTAGQTATQASTQAVTQAATQAATQANAQAITAKPKAQTLPAPSPAASAATSVEARLYTLSELPEDVRSSLPALTVGGAMYSQTPANRMLIINGQVFREGDALAPGLVLEQIKLKSAVLKVKGLRYGISY